MLYDLGIQTKMPTINNKFSWPSLAALFGAAIGALSGQFVWALIAGVGLWAVAYIAQNLTCFFQRTNTTGVETTSLEADSAIPSSIEKSSDWLEKWNEEVNYCPTYKGAPGNIWNGPKWASDD